MLEFIPRFLIHGVKSMLIMVISGFCVIGIHEACTRVGIPIDSSVMDFEKTVQEILKGFPHVGEVAGLIFDTRDAIGKNVGTVGISLYMEIINGLILFGAFKLMYGIKCAVDRVFLVTEQDTGLLVASMQYFTMMVLVFFSVMLMSVLKEIVKVFISSIGLKSATYLLLAIIIAGVVFSVWIGKKCGIENVVINTAFELLFGFVTVGLIYILVLCMQLLNVYSGAMSINEFIMCISGEILSLLGLTIIGANTVSKALTGLFKI